MKITYFMAAMTLITREQNRLNITQNYSISNNYIVRYFFVPNCTQFITLDTECEQRKIDC